MARNRRQLSVKEVLAWADAWRRRTGRWPEVQSGVISEAPGENWRKVDNALRLGLRGMKGGSSLAQLLSARRGTWNRKDRPLLFFRDILAWADAHHQRTGHWPIASSGPVRGVKDETWGGIDGAFKQGTRGLQGGDSLARFLEERRGVRNRKNVPRLTIKQILLWGDAHVKREGLFPDARSGPVHGARGETWGAIAKALYAGTRGLPGGMSLPGLFAGHRHVRTQKHLPQLNERQILRWADAHRKRTGAWPTGDSGSVEGGGGESWGAIRSALNEGGRGLPGGTSLARLLEEKRGKRHPLHLPPLSVKKIVAWADDYYRRFGCWPLSDSGRVHAAPGETWSGVAAALSSSSRSLRGRTTLPKLLARHRAVRNTGDLPDLTIAQILRWADAHHRRTGRWPKPTSGPIHGTRDENWLGMQTALVTGCRGLRGGITLPQMLARRRGARNMQDLPPLTTPQIIKWAKTYYRRHKSWPQRQSGVIPGTNGETWSAVFHALYNGRRGFRGKSSLARFLNKHCRPEKGL